MGIGGGVERRAERKLNYHARTYSISPHYAIETLSDPCRELLYRKSGDENPFRLVVGLLVLSQLEGDEKVDVDGDVDTDVTPKRRCRKKRDKEQDGDGGRSESSISADYLYGDHVAGLKLAMTCEGAIVKDDLLAHMVEDRWGWNERRDCKQLKR